MRDFKQKNNSKGITLIALVITIIVLLILAAISIATLTGENGILTKAGEASENSKDAEEDERVKLVVATALSDNLGKGLTTESLKDAIGKEFGEDKKDNLEGDGPWIYEGERKNYEINKAGQVTSDEATKEGWKQLEGGTIQSIDGTITGIQIGDYINYDPKAGVANIEQEQVTSKKEMNGYQNQTFKLSSFSDTWQILGVENKKILIMPSNPISVDEGGQNGSFALQTTAGYEHGINELNEISKLYGKGKYAVGARSITVEDINKITGYNPNCVGVKNPTEEQIKNGTKCGSGLVTEYGCDVKYYWDESNEPYYEGPNNFNGNLSDYLGSHNRTGFFLYTEEDGWKTVQRPSTFTNSREYITSIKNTNYSYDVDTLGGSDKVGLLKDTDLYNWLIRDKRYWLASRCMGPYVLWSSGSSYIPYGGY